MISAVEKIVKESHQSLSRQIQELKESNEKYKESNEKYTDEVKGLTEHIRMLWLDSSYPLLLRSFVYELKLQGINKYLLQRNGSHNTLNRNNFRKTDGTFDYGEFNKKFVE